MKKPWKSSAGAGRSSRRQFIICSGMAVAAGGVASRASAADEPAHSQDDHVAFFVVGDTHYFADAANPSRLDEKSAAVTQGLIDQLNALVGQEIPDHAGGGMVREPFGVIHAGDVIDTGDKTGKLQAEMQRTEIAAFERAMGLTGRDAALDFPVYEVHGNHDSPSGTGHAIDRIIERTKNRPRVSHVSSNGLHYSWDVGDVHFVNLGIVVGSVPGIARRRRYAPRESLEFLVKDLAEKVGDSGRPVIITHHVDIARYTTPVPDDAPFSDKEWDPADVGGFHTVLHDYNVAGIFYGHTHARNVWRWDGISVAPAAEQLAEDTSSSDERRSLDVFNVDNSSHFGGPQQAFFYVECAADGLTVREYATKDAWKTGMWAPLVWRRAAALVSCLAWAVICCVATAAAAESATTPAPVTFAAIGDFGLDIWKPKSNPDDGTKPHERRNPYQAKVANLVAGWKPDFVVTTGDNNYPKGEASTIDANIGKYYAAFIGDYKGIHGPGSKENRFFPVLGNHDWDAPGAGCQAHVDYFTLPGNERYYEFVWGPVHFFMLDNDRREPDGTEPGSKQHRWFLDAIAKSDKPFQVVVAHHPPYSSGEHGGIKHADWDYDSHGVDLMLSGHDHNYERIEREGVTYIVNGAGGANLRRMHDPVEGSAVAYREKHGAMKVTVSPVAGTPGQWTLVSRFIDVGGRTIDEFSLSRSAP